MRRFKHFIFGPKIFINGFLQQSKGCKKDIKFQVKVQKVMFVFFCHEKLSSSGLNNGPPQPTTHQPFFTVVCQPPAGVNLQMLDTTFQHSNY